MVEFATDSQTYLNALDQNLDAFGKQIATLISIHQTLATQQGDASVQSTADSLTQMLSWVNETRMNIVTKANAYDSVSEAAQSVTA
jgi:hypothetical protein